MRTDCGNEYNRMTAPDDDSMSNSREANRVIYVEGGASGDRAWRGSLGVRKSRICERLVKCTYALMGIVMSIVNQLTLALAESAEFDDMADLDVLAADE